MDEEQPARKPKLNDLGQHEILCADCDSVLLIMMQTQDTDFVNKFKVENCPKCGGESWLNTLIGKYFIAQAEGMTIKSMTFDEETQIMRIRM
jgi:hypothetical protein